MPPKRAIKDTYASITAKAVAEWGLTDNPRTAGYILLDGTLLDLAEGQGYRVHDHREIAQFFDEAFDYSKIDRGDVMHKYMDLGAIRWMPEGPGIYVRAVPTQAQRRAIDRLLEPMADEEEVHVDVTSSKYGEKHHDFSRLDGVYVSEAIAEFYASGNLGYNQEFEIEESLIKRILEHLLS
jgi:hypothetical protein